MIENTGYDFTELENEKEYYKDRFEVIVFNEINLTEAEYLRNTDAVCYHENFAINYANIYSNLMKISTFSIKINGWNRSTRKNKIIRRRK